VKALFDAPTYELFKKLEVRVGPKLGSENGKNMAIWEFAEARDTAVKAMYEYVIGQ
jgi:hypothetical protein